MSTGIKQTLYSSGIRTKQSLSGTVNVGNVDAAQTLHSSDVKVKQNLSGKTNIGSILKGEPGQDGATFIPVLDPEGNLSWINDKGLDNPEPVNIKGPKGEIDYGEVTRIVDEYLEENPPIPHITINGEGPDENGNFTVKTQPDSNVVEF